MLPVLHRFGKALNTISQKVPVIPLKNLPKPMFL
jgi:hypothetical protein